MKKERIFGAIPTQTALRAGQSEVVTLSGPASDAWTRKQKQYFDRNNIPYDFRDCDKNECRDDLAGFPTLDNILGYHEI